MIETNWMFRNRKIFATLNENIHEMILALKHMFLALKCTFLALKYTLLAIKCTFSALKCTFLCSFMLRNLTKLMKHGQFC